VKLYMLPASPFARKARIIARELDLMRMIEEVAVDLADKPAVRKFNPLGKIPALQLDDGSVLFDSPVICEYLDDLGGGKFFPKPNIWGDIKGRWKALTLQALADGVMDAAVLRRRETVRPAEQQSRDMFALHEGAILASLDALERITPSFAEYPAIGEIATACALGYVDLRWPESNWRETRPQLAAWFAGCDKYASFVATKP
jgi:glutathione S-transferase